MGRYRKKPVVIEAIQLSVSGSDQWDEVAAFLGTSLPRGVGSTPP